MATPETVYRALGPREIEARDQALELLSVVSGLAQPIGIEDLQHLYDQVLDEALEHQGDLIVSLGISFGQTFMTEPDFEWARVSDEYGEETVVAVKSFQLNAAPVSMIDKRIQRGERIDLAMLRRDTIKRLRELVAAGDIMER